jgi:hypothetical protein
MLRPGILTTFYLPVQDHSYPALPLAGMTVYTSTLIIGIRLTNPICHDKSHGSRLALNRSQIGRIGWAKAAPE